MRAFTPQFVKTSVLPDFDGGVDSWLVCSNCGDMQEVGTGLHKLIQHINNCPEIAAPYRWEIPDAAEGEQVQLMCNGILVLTAPDFSYFPVAKLNKYQASPFEYVSEEYLYKYELRTELNEYVNELKRVLDEAQGAAGHVLDILKRGERYLDAATFAAYCTMLREVATGLSRAITATNPALPTLKDEES